MAGQPVAQRPPQAMAPQARQPPRLSPFDNLQSELNRLFAQIGLAASQTSRPIDDRRRMLKQAYGETNTRIQDICDRIEDELNKAKFSMRREYLRFQIHEAEEAKRKQEELAAQKLASSRVAESQPTANQTPVTQDIGDVMDIDDLTDSATKSGVANSSPAGMHLPTTSSMLPVPAGISPAPDMDVDALFNEVTSTATPHATTNSQQPGGDEMDILGNADASGGDVGGLLPLDSFSGMQDSTDQSINKTVTSQTQPTEPAAATSQPTVTATGDLAFDLLNMDFTTGGVDGETQEEGAEQNEENGDDFENWLASIG